MANLINNKTPMTDYMAIINKDNTMCPEATDWLQGFIKDNPDCTFGVLSDHLDKYGSTTGFKVEPWITWTLKMFGEQFSTKERTVMLNRLTDPMMSFTLYTGLSWMTDKEDAVLLGKFKDKLPTAEHELKTGKVKRAK